MRSPWLFVPPPLLFVGSFITGVLFGRLVPAPLVRAALAPIFRGVGVAVIAAAAAGLLVPALGWFIYRRTTLVPQSASARVLVAAGPFRVTRNPMYLGLAVAYVGATLVSNVAWPLAVLALPLWVMNARVIPYEEATLARVFGADYRAYQQRVRRWI